MLRIEIKDGENIERALKRYKRKHTHYTHTTHTHTLHTH